MGKRHKDAVQDRVLSIEQTARVLRFAAAKHARASADRRAGRLAADGGWRNLDCGIVSDAL